jgi:LPS export ABC transporter protein LptC
MVAWQRRARLLIAVAAVAFAIVVAVAFRPRAPEQAPVAPVPPTDPAAVVESASGTTIRVNREQEEVRVEYERLLSYPDGVTRMVGMKVTTVRAGGRTFVLTGNEGTVAQEPSAFEVSGDVELTSSDGLLVRGGEARYSEQDGLVRVPGPVTFREGRTSGTSVGMTYHKTTDALTLLEQAVVKVAPGDDGTDAIAMQGDRAEFQRSARTIRFEGGMKAVGDTRVIEAQTATAFLGGEEGQLQRLELRGNARISAPRPAPGGLRTLDGSDMDLEYAEDGRTLRQAAIRDDAVIVLAGEPGGQGRRLSGRRIDMTLDVDGETPVDLRAVTDVRLALPGPKGRATRTVTADTFEASGEGGSGLSEARFGGGIVFREQGSGVDRVVRSRTLETTMAAGLGEIQAARFAGAVRFVDGGLTALGDRAAYGVTDGTLELRSSTGSDRPPRLVDARVAVEAQEIDVALAGPRIRARGAVKSELLPLPGEPGGGGGPGGRRRVPSMLRADQPVIVVADAFEYDASGSRATYNGAVRLSQGDTSIKGASLILDERTGDLQAAGDVVTTTVLDHAATDGRLERVASIARAGSFAYEEAVRRATYTDRAQVGGPHGEMRASRIELFLGPSGHELERVEAYEDVTLIEQRRRTTGSRLTYYSEDNRYVVIGSPVKIVDDCNRETTGRTLTFYQDTDRVVVDGNEQIRTRTTGASTCP